MNRYDVIVIGGGPAGYKAALKLAGMDKKVCIVDRSSAHLGGTCLNEGCIPVKSLLKSSEVYKTVKEASEYGVNAGECSFSLSAMIDKMQKNVSILNAGLAGTIKRAKIDVVEGTAEFLDKNTLKVKDDNLSADYIIIAAGSVSSDLPDIKADGAKILTSRELLLNDRVPEKLLIIGGGVIGCEFATFYSRLGSSVTIVEPMPELLPNEDEDTGKAVRREFKKAGIVSDTSSLVKSLEYDGEKIKAVISGKKVREDIFDLVLLAVGRKANIEGLNLVKAGVQTEKGHVKVNEFMQTTADNIYCAGDAADGWMLAHTAYDEGMCAAKNIVYGNRYKPERTAVPRVVFCYPEVGAVGLTEEQAAENHDIKISKSLFKPNGKAIIDGAGEGFVKIISDTRTDTVLGVSVVGKLATELVHEFVPAVKNRMKISELSTCVHGHPTLSELFWEALQD